MDALAERLSEHGRAAYALVDNRDPTRVPALIEQLPDRLRQQIAALHLSRHNLSRLEAKLVLLHGRDDPMIPSTQSEALARAVPSGRAELFIVDGLMHVDVQQGWDDALELWRAAVALLRARDGEVGRASARGS